jgi:HAD superfamily hydrolase (TIGR01509 family)
MKKILFSLIASTLATTSLIAAPQAVVFDWGNVLATDDRSVVVSFMCKTFQFSESDFETVNLEKRKAMKAGKSDIDFWLNFAKQKGIRLSDDWPEAYTATLKASVGADPEMFVIINELKDQKIRIGLLSNINDRYTKLIRDFGFYEPFDPCLLSCEIGLEKPNKEAYEALLQAIKLSPEEIIFIDDKAENVEAAKTLGIDAVLFESPYQIRKELLKRELLTLSKF